MMYSHLNEDSKMLCRVRKNAVLLILIIRSPVVLFKKNAILFSLMDDIREATSL